MNNCIAVVIPGNIGYTVTCLFYNSADIVAVGVESGTAGQIFFIVVLAAVVSANGTDGFSAVIVHTAKTQSVDIYHKVTSVTKAYCFSNSIIISYSAQNFNLPKAFKPEPA